MIALARFSFLLLFRWRHFSRFHGLVFAAWPSTWEYTMLYRINGFSPEGGGVNVHYADWNKCRQLGRWDRLFKGHRQREGGSGEEEEGLTSY